MKRTIIFLLAFSAIAFSLTSIQGGESNSDLNEIKNIIQYSNFEEWTVSAYSGTTPVGSCGPTHSGGACSITGLSAGTYTIRASKGGCTGSLTNVYHPGTGITTLYFGPVNPDLVCDFH